VTTRVALDEYPEFLTVEEAAAVLRISRTSAYQLAQEWRLTKGKTGLPVVRLGRLLRVPRAALVRLVDAA
jgi:excisionase family DNA binding protein